MGPELFEFCRACARRCKPYTITAVLLCFSHGQHRSSAAWLKMEIVGLSEFFTLPGAFGDEFPLTAATFPRSLQ